MRLDAADVDLLRWTVEHVATSARLLRCPHFEAQLRELGTKLVEVDANATEETP